MKPCCHHLNEGHRLVAQLEEFVDEPAEHENGADIILTYWAQQAAKRLAEYRVGR